MSELETGTKPSKYTLATRETLIKIADDRDELKKALEEISSGRCMLHFEYYDIAKAALNG